MQCYYVKIIQDFKIIKITQRHNYKLIDHTSLFASSMVKKTGCLFNCLGQVIA